MCWGWHPGAPLWWDCQSSSYSLLSNVLPNQIVASKLVGACIASTSDYFTYELAIRLYDSGTARWAVSSRFVDLIFQPRLTTNLRRSSFFPSHPGSTISA